MGVLRMYLRLRKRYYSPKLFEFIRSYVRTCHECQTRMKMKYGPKASFVRIPYDFKPMTSLSCDVKYMPLSREGYKYLLFVTCEVSNYVIAVALREANSIHIAESLLNRVIYQFGVPERLIFDEDKSMSSNVMMHIYNTLGIRPIVISPTNHGSLRTERYIRTISKPRKKATSPRRVITNAFLPASVALNFSYQKPISR